MENIDLYKNYKKKKKERWVSWLYDCISSSQVHNINEQTYKPQIEVNEKL